MRQLTTDLDTDWKPEICEHGPDLGSQHSHAGRDVRLQVPGETVRGVVHVLQYQTVHPALQVDLGLVFNLLNDLLDGAGGGRGPWQGWEMQHPDNVAILVTK